MSLPEGLVGAWRLRRFAFTDLEGEEWHPMGEHPDGSLMITPDRVVAFSFMASDRPRFVSDGVFDGSEAERAQAAASFVGFGGPFMIEDDVLVIDVAWSLFPNWTGGFQRRKFSLDGDSLTLGTEGPAMFGGVLRTAQANLIRWHSA